MPALRTLVAFLHPTYTHAYGIYYSSICRCDTLLIGAAVALWLRGPGVPVATVRRYASIVLVAAPLLLMAGYLLEPRHTAEVFLDGWVQTFGFTLIGLTAASVLLLAIDPASVLQRPLHNGVLSSLGRISYGLYIFHALPSDVLGFEAQRLKPHHLAFLIPIAAFAFAYTAARLSFRFLEAPFLSLKSYF
jgi:peptidoglycan/LPS O-acetylase OafA/YrhL